jgi:NADH-quinone oxidoreductase subunit J
VNPVLFFALAAIVIGGAAGVIFSRNPVHSALCLVATMVAVAVLFLGLDAQLLAVIQIVVYASAIVVLFLFVIMLLGVDQPEALEEPRPWMRPVAVGLGAILVIEIVGLASHHWVTGAVRVAGDPRSLDNQGNVRRLAEVLFTDYFWAFQITAVLLVIAVVGGVVLARRSRQVPVARASEALHDPAARPGSVEEVAAR